MTHILILFAGLILGYILGRAHNTLANIARQLATDLDPAPAPEESPEPRPSVFRKDKGKELPLYLPGQGRLTEEQAKLRVACGMDPAKTEILTPEEIAKETRVVLKRRTAEAPYKLIIQKPGKRRRIYPYYNREQAMDAFNACPNRNFPPDTSVILDDTLAPK